MENKDAIRVGEKFNKPPYLPEDLRQAIDYFITLAKDYEQAKSGLPEKKKFNHPGRKLLPEDINCRLAIDVHNACLHQVALGMVKLKKRLPQLILEKTAKKDYPCINCNIRQMKGNKINCFCEKVETWNKELSQVIWKEMGVGE